MQDYHELRVWQKAHETWRDLTVEVTDTRRMLYGLRNKVLEANAPRPARRSASVRTPASEERPTDNAQRKTQSV